MGIREARRRWALRLGPGDGRARPTCGPARTDCGAALGEGRSASRSSTGSSTGFVGNASLWVDLVRVPPSGTWERRRADRLGLAEDWVGPADATEDGGSRPSRRGLPAGVRARAVARHRGCGRASPSTDAKRGRGGPRAGRVPRRGWHGARRPARTRRCRIRTRPRRCASCRTGRRRCSSTRGGPGSCRRSTARGCSTEEPVLGRDRARGRPGRWPRGRSARDGSSSTRTRTSSRQTASGRGRTRCARGVPRMTAGDQAARTAGLPSAD